MSEEFVKHESKLDKTTVKPNLGGLMQRAWLYLQDIRLNQFRWDDATIKERLFMTVELLVVIIWALMITSSYLDLNPRVVPTGQEYPSAIQTHHLWTQFSECGLCALWNGNVRGGAPAFVDLHGSMLHPLVILTTLGWGVVNGSKLALVACFIMSGLAQWWLARVLGLSWPARLWSACMAVAAGHLTGRMELGAFGVVLSTAACALVLPPLVSLVRTASQRDAVLLGVTLALAAVAGQGYMQVGLLLTLPAILLLVPWKPKALTRLLPRFALAAGLAFLLAAPFLLPFLHFLPQLVKETDPVFKSAQPFAYIPLNLVITDYEFFTSEALNKLPYPHLNVNYIGWVALLLALWALRGSRNQLEQKVVAFFAMQAVLAFWVASAVPLILLNRFIPLQTLNDLIAGIRHPPQIAGLAVPPLLALAAIGLDQLLNVTWPQLRLTFAATDKSSPAFSLDLRWLLLFPLILNLTSARSFGQQWINTTELGLAIPSILQGLHTPDMQWVNAPFGEHFYTEAAISMGLKLGSGIRTWNWKDRPHPEPVLVADYLGPPPNMTEQSVIDGVTIYAAPPGQEYAAVEHADGSRTICTAQGSGGNIDVSCETPQAGLLTVKENTWSGWDAQIDARSVELEASQWLAVKIPAGNHTIQFRYRPWDVALGLLLCIGGVALAFYSWWKGDQNKGSIKMMALSVLLY